MIHHPTILDTDELEVRLAELVSTGLKIKIHLQVRRITIVNHILAAVFVHRRFALSQAMAERISDILAPEQLTTEVLTSRGETMIVRYLLSDPTTVVGVKFQIY